MDVPFCPSSAPSPVCMAQLGTAGLSLDFQVIGKAAGVLQLPTVVSNNGQEDSRLRVSPAANTADIGATLGSLPWFHAHACRTAFHSLSALPFPD